MTFSVAIFPYLKTSTPMQIGRYRFRSTTDLAGLPEDQAIAVRDIASMLYVRDDWRVVSGSYAIVPKVDVNMPAKEFDHLLEIHACVTYLYSQPHEVFDSIFLKPEDCICHVLTPGQVSVYLVRPQHHTEELAPLSTRPDADRFGFVSGYQGLFGLRQPFWVEKGSRIYPPHPHATLNISQDLALDFGYPDIEYRRGPSPLQLMHAPADDATNRIFTALTWYNFANEHNVGPDRALLNLAIAFEALLNLPQDAKSNRFIDTVALLLGRTPRLDVWAKQFYDARSRVAHEGRARDLHLYHSELGGKPGKLDGRAASLMFYGRQIFQFCVSTLIVGRELARRGDLREKLVTNTERLTEICKIFGPTQGAPESQFKAVASQIAALQRYQFLQEAPIPIDLKLNAVRLAAVALSACTDVVLPPGFTEAVAACAAPAASTTTLAKIEAVGTTSRLAKGMDQSMVPFALRSFVQLIEYVHLASVLDYPAAKRNADHAPAAASN